MVSKMTFLAGVGVGYVLGARAGRQRYDQIAGAAQRLWRNPRVQETVSTAQSAAMDKAGEAASAAAHTAGEAASAAAHSAGAAGSALADKVRDVVSSDDDEPTDQTEPLEPLDPMSPDPAAPAAAPTDPGPAAEPPLPR